MIQLFLQLQAHKIYLTFALVGILWGCGSERTYLDGAVHDNSPTLSSMPVTNIVSLDYCADQYLLELASPHQITALSHDSQRSFSYHRKLAKNFPSVRPLIEDVLQLEPQAVIRTYGGGPNAQQMFERAGVKVINIGFTNTITQIQETTVKVAHALGVPAQCEQVVARMQQRLQKIAKLKHQQKTLYVTPSGVTSGPGSLVHEILLAAGLENYVQTPGWHPMPLEHMVYENPDVIATAFYESDNNQRNAWTLTNHPVAQNIFANSQLASVQGAWTACGGWFVIDAIEALAAQVQLSASNL